MRKYRQMVEFANLICHFGDKVLLDYLDEIILPSFLEGQRVRMYGNSKYLLHNVKLTNFLDAAGKKAPALIGRFVMDTELRRDQIFVNGKIVQDPDRIKSAPSSLFVLLLENHKLIYAKQVAGAPGLSAFRTTIELLIKHRRSEYIHSIFEKNKEARELDPSLARVTKQSLMDSIPVPVVQIVPLADTRNLEAFVRQFKILKEVSIKVVKPNAEINNDGLFDTVESARDRVNATATSLVHKNPEGLNKVESIRQIAPAMEGNAIVKLRGTSATDAKLAGSNEEISVREYLDVPTAVVPGARAMYRSFLNLLGAGIIRLGRTVTSPENLRKLERLNDGG